MWQSTAWLGAEAGVFKRRGIDMTFPAIAVGGPPAAAGVIRGDWEFAHTGTLPVAEEVLKGQDIVILATPTSEFANSFIMTRKEITELTQLSGKKIGVLTETGQTSVATRVTIEKAGRMCRSSNSSGSMRHWLQERSMQARYPSICASPVSSATAGMHFL